MNSQHEDEKKGRLVSRAPFFWKILPLLAPKAGGAGRIVPINVSVGTQSEGCRSAFPLGIIPT